MTSRERRELREKVRKLLRFYRRNLITSPEDIIFFIKANDLAIRKKLPKYMFISPTTEDILHANLGSMHNYLKFTQEVIICIKFKDGEAIIL